MKVVTEAGTDLEKSHFPEAIAAMKSGVQAIVGLGQDQEPVQIETEQGVIRVGNMIIS